MNVQLGQSKQAHSRFAFGRVVGLFCLLFLAANSLAHGQANGAISGHVTDTTGASLTNASVVITETQTGVASTTITNDSGFYTVNQLKPGIYSVQVRAQGFRAALSKNLTLQVAQVLQQDFSLQIGNVQENVNVTASAPLLNTETTDLGNVVDRTPIMQLPLNGRNFSQLALLVPGTNAGEMGGTRSTGNGNETQRGGANVVANGARATFNTYLIDGLNDNDQLIGTIKVFPNIEDIQEFKVQIGNYDTQYMGGGAVINVTTASGSNNLHGSLFEFVRNDALNAREYFDAPGVIPPYKQNQFGGSISGPIKKEKIFYFGDFQGLRVHQSFSSIVSEPTVRMRSGDFGEISNVIYDPATYNSSTNTRTAFTSNGFNVIPTNRLDPVAISLLQTMPVPNLPGTVNNTRLNQLQSNSQNQFDVRVDAVLSSKDSVFARYTYGTAQINFPNTPLLLNGKLNPLAFAQPSGNGLRNNSDPSQQATLQGTHTFSPVLNNQFILGYTREALNVAPIDQGYNTSTKLGLVGSDYPGQGSSLVATSFSNYLGFSSSNMPEIVPQNTIEAADSMTYVHGAHVFVYGADFIHNNFGFLQVTALSGKLSWTGNYTNNPASSSKTGYDFADYMLGLPSSSTITSVASGTPVVSYSEFGSYAQDTWRVTPRLTLTPGIRWDLFSNPLERKDRLTDFIPGPSGFTGINNTGSIIAQAGQGYSRGVLGTPYSNFSPRIGASYRLGDKNVIRGSYGMFYFDEQGTGGSARLFLNYPYVVTNTLNCTSTAPCLSTSAGIPSSITSSVLPQATYMPLNFPTSHLQQWNLTVERQLSDALVVRGSYVGTHGQDLNLAFNPNTAYPGAGAVASRQPYSNFSTINGWAPIGISNYHALQLSAEKRMSQGFYSLAAYTWSRSLDMGPGGNSSNSEGRANMQDPRNPQAEYGLSDFNYSHRFTNSNIYLLPFGRDRRFLADAGPVTDAILGGWQATTILTMQSGAPFSVQMGTSQANTGTFTRPNRVCNGNLPSSSRTLSKWYDTSCFVGPPQYAFGNTGRNILIGPGLLNLDFSMNKEFHVTEGTALQFRAETFNILNHANFNIPGASIGTSSAATVTSVNTHSRQIQIAARLHW
jgi:hypothetical protein